MIFTTGYLTWTPEALETVVEQLDAMVVDIRLTPQSRNPAWRQNALIKRFDERYIWVKEWGNVRYKIGPPVELLDFDAGLAHVRELSGNLILLCACRQYDACHRKDVAERLKSLGIETEELGA